MSQRIKRRRPTKVADNPYEAHALGNEVASALARGAKAELVAARHALADVSEDGDGKADARAACDDEYRCMGAPADAGGRAVRAVDERAEKHGLARRQLGRRRRKVERAASAASLRHGDRRIVGRRRSKASVLIRLGVHPAAGLLPELVREALTGFDEEDDLLLDVGVVDRHDRERMALPDGNLPDLEEDVLAWRPAKRLRDAQRQPDHAGRQELRERVTGRDGRSDRPRNLGRAMRVKRERRRRAR